MQGSDLFGELLDRVRESQLTNVRIGVPTIIPPEHVTSELLALMDNAYIDFSYKSIAWVLILSLHFSNKIIDRQIATSNTYGKVVVVSDCLDDSLILSCVLANTSPNDESLRLLWCSDDEVYGLLCKLPEDFNYSELLFVACYISYSCLINIIYKLFGCGIRSVRLYNDYVAKFSEYVDFNDNSFVRDIDRILVTKFRIGHSKLTDEAKKRMAYVCHLN